MNTMRPFAVIVGLAFAVALAVFVALEISAEAVAVVVGVACGILAGIPTSVLILFAVARNDARTRAHARDARPMFWVIVPEGRGKQEQWRPISGSRETLPES